MRPGQRKVEEIVVLGEKMPGGISDELSASCAFDFPPGPSA